jgi:hypothetical protein
MTTFNRRDLPHPTLKPSGSDYEGHIHFRAEPAAIRRSAQTEDISIALKYRLNSNVLRALIEAGQAHYHTLTECVSTKLRESHLSEEDVHTIRLNAKRYCGQVLIRPFVIASQAIENIPNDEWGPGVRQLLPDGASVPNGAILAIGAEKSFDTDATTDLESYVEITPSQAVQRGRFNLDLSGQRIVILINPEDKPDIDRMRRDEDSLQALFPSMYQRAIEEAVRLHRKDEHTDKRWAARIADKLTDHDLVTDDPDILEANALDYAQQIMENPLSRITTLAPAQRASEN